MTERDRGKRGEGERGRGEEGKRGEGNRFKYQTVVASGFQEDPRLLLELHVQRTFPVRPLEVLAKSYKTSFSQCPSAGAGERARLPVLAAGGAKRAAAEGQVRALCTGGVSLGSAASH